MLLHFDPFLLTTSAELQLAVALLPARLIVRLLGLRLHSVLLRHTTPHHRLRQHSTLLLLRRSCMRRLRSTNGHCRLLDRIRFCEENLRRYQSRLRKSGVLQLFGVWGNKSQGQNSTRSRKGDSISLLFLHFKNA